MLLSFSYVKDKPVLAKEIDLNFFIYLTLYIGSFFIKNILSLICFTIKLSQSMCLLLMYFAQI